MATIKLVPPTKKKAKAESHKKKYEDCDGSGHEMSGRKPGTQSYYTIRVKSAVSAFIDDNMDVFKESFEQLEAKEKCDVFLKMMGFVIPKMASNEIAATVENVDANSELKQLAESVEAKAAI